MTPDLWRYARRGLRQGTWPLLQRYAVAPKILRLPPLTVAVESDFTLHIRVCERDAVRLHWAVRSFFRHASVSCQLVIHDDGSCRPATLAKFAASFPQCRVIRRDEARRLIEPRLAPFPELTRWWRADYTGIKWIDFYLLGQSPFVIFLDSDVLFFDDPVQLFAPRDGAVWMKDSFYSLYFEEDEARQCYGVAGLPQLNSGLGRVPRAWFDATLADDVLRRMRSAAIANRAVARDLPVNDDQTFNAVLTARHGAWEYLSDDYCLAMEPGLGLCVAKHMSAAGALVFTRRASRASPNNSD